jgi:hypothetical protein
MLNSVLQSRVHINNSYLNEALIQSEDSSVSIVNGLAGPMEFDSWQGRKSSLHSHLYKVILEPTQHPIQWACEALSAWQNINLTVHLLPTFDFSTTQVMSVKLYSSIHMKNVNLTSFSEKAF